MLHPRSPTTPPVDAVPPGRLPGRPWPALRHLQRPPPAALRHVLRPGGGRGRARRVRAPHVPGPRPALQRLLGQPALALRGLPPAWQVPAGRPQRALRAARAVPGAAVTCRRLAFGPISLSNCRMLLHQHEQPANHKLRLGRLRQLAPPRAWPAARRGAARSAAGGVHDADSSRRMEAAAQTRGAGAGAVHQWPASLMGRHRGSYTICDSKSAAVKHTQNRVLHTHKACRPTLLHTHNACRPTLIVRSPALRMPQHWRARMLSPHDL